MKPSFPDDKTHFIGVILPPHLEREAEGKRMWTREKYGCRSGQSTRPHITLIPPFSSSMKTEVIVDEVRGILEGRRSFTSFLQGYGAFGGRTLFMKVVESEEWRVLSRDVSMGLRAMGEKIKVEKKPFVPHITIANRDIPEGAIGEMLSSLSGDKLPESFMVERIGVFHRKGWQWVLSTEDVVTLSL